MTQKLWEVNIVHPNTKWGLMAGNINEKLQKLNDVGAEIISVTIFQQKHLDHPSALIVYRFAVRKKESIKP